MKLVQIYSNEHGMWWRPDYCGYTEDSDQAGVFDYEEAKKQYPEITYDSNAEDYFVDVSESCLEAKIEDLDWRIAELQKQRRDLLKLSNNCKK